MFAINRSSCNQSILWLWCRWKGQSFGSKCSCSSLSTWSLSWCRTTQDFMAWYRFDYTSLTWSTLCHQLISTKLNCFCRWYIEISSHIVTIDQQYYWSWICDRTVTSSYQWCFTQYLYANHKCASHVWIELRNLMPMLMMNHVILICASFVVDHILFVFEHVDLHNRVSKLDLPKSHHGQCEGYSC